MRVRYLVVGCLAVPRTIDLTPRPSPVSMVSSIETGERQLAQCQLPQGLARVLARCKSLQTDACGGGSESASMQPMLTLRSDCGSSRSIK